MAIGQHQDLSVVACLEQLLGTPVHVSDDRLAMDNAFVAQFSSEGEATMRAGVVVPEVKCDIAGLECCGAYRNTHCVHGGIVACGSFTCGS